MRTIMIAIFIAAGLMLGACGPSQILVSQRFVGDRVVRYTIEPTGQGNDETGELFNLLARVCTQGGDGSDIECKDSLLLENVQPRSIY